MPTPLASPLVAVDAHVLMDLGAGSEPVMDALATIWKRLVSARIVIPPTAKLELIHIAHWGDTPEDRQLAANAITAARIAGIVPINLMPVSHGIVERVAEALRAAGLIPVAEVNDSQLVVEAALMGARLLLSSDGHLRGRDFERLTMELHNFDLTAPVIATPSEVVRKFFLRWSCFLGRMRPGLNFHCMDAAKSANTQLRRWMRSQPEPATATGEQANIHETTKTNQTKGWRL